MAKKVSLAFLGHFGGHFETRPLFGISRILKICYVILVFTVFAYKTGILTLKKHFFFLLLVSKSIAKKVVFAFFRTFWRPFETRPLFRISRILKICYTLLFFLKLFLHTKLLF